jgi:hypothetical protein
VAKAHPAARRSQIDKQVVAAHERVLEEWSDERVEELPQIVRDEPLHEPVSPSPLEAAFYFRREMVMSEIEMEPVTETFAGGLAAVVDYEVAE